MGLLQCLFCLHIPSHCGDFTHDPTSQGCLALDLEVWFCLDNQYSCKFYRWFSGEEDSVDRKKILTHTLPIFLLCLRLVPQKLLTNKEKEPEKKSYANSYTAH